MAIVGLLIYAKAKPELDKCREIAYDKLAQMERSDFSMLSDTLIYDKDGKQIGLINAGHYQYVDISKDQHEPAKRLYCPGGPPL